MNSTVIAIGSVGLVIIGFLTWRTTRSTSRDALRVAQKQTDLNIFLATIATLRAELQDAQTEATEIRNDLHEVRKETRLLRTETTTALANVAILSDHIREHVAPEVPFPRLRRVHTNGN